MNMESTAIDGEVGRCIGGCAIPYARESRSQMSTMGILGSLESYASGTTGPNLVVGGCKGLISRSYIAPMMGVGNYEKFRNSLIFASIYIASPASLKQILGVWHFGFPEFRSHRIMEAG